MFLFVRSTWCPKIQDQMQSLEDTKQCLKVKEFKQYSAKVKSTDMDMELMDGNGLTNENDSMIQYNLRFSSNIRGWFTFHVMALGSSDP